MASLPYTFDGEDKTVELTDATPANLRKPVVLLLHGTGGSKTDMIDPGVSPDRAYDHGAPFPPDRTIGWRAYPGVGVWSFELDPEKPVRGWRPFLEAHDFRTAVYSQVDSTGFLARPLEELAVVLKAVRGVLPSDATLAVIAQSRGGLLIRRFLKDHAGEVGWIRKVITLHAAHDGSRLANVAGTVRQVIDDLEDAVPVLGQAFGWLRDMVDMDAYQELAVGSPFLQDLANGETALPGIEYYTFGGTSVRWTRLRSWVYTPGSAIPHWHLPPFRHRITVIEVPGASPLLDSLPDITAEITEGRGDTLVADRRAHLSFAIPRTNALNHGETLWDSELQRQVLAILDGEPMFWG